MVTHLELYVTPATGPVPSTPDYERRTRLGAIRIRRDAADVARRQACDAHLAGNYGDAHRLHAEADLHEDAIERYMREIGLINVDEDRKLTKVPPAA